MVTEQKIVVTSPDPSDRATAALMHEIATVKEFFSDKFISQERAVALLQARADKMPSIDVVNQDLIALGKIMVEKFSAVQIQIKDRDTALAAALAAQEKAILVQNNNFIKQIDNIATLLATQGKNSDEKIDTIKERVGLLETKASSTEGKSTGIDKTWGAFAIAAALIVSVAGFIISRSTATPITPQNPPIIYLGPAPGTQPTVIQPRQP
jgi:hypothetical protein